MGWFWSGATPPPMPRASAPARPPQQAPPTPAPPQSELDSDPEIQKFLALFQEELRESRPAQPEASPSPALAPSAIAAAAAASRREAPPPAAAAPPPPPPPTPKPSPSWFSWRPSAAPAPPTRPEAAREQERRDAEDEEEAKRALADSLLPTSMSCRQAFDLAWGCQSPVGQWNAIYRHGSVRSCGELWDDFWFCMRVKGYPAGKVKEDEIRDYCRRKEARKYAPGLPSSEDVWEARARKVESGTAFRGVYVQPDASDAEVGMAEMERRRRIRERLGYVDSPK